MEKLKLTLMICSLVAIALCFGASVWLYVNGFGMLYMVMFAFAIVWQGYVLWSYWRSRH